MKPNYDTNMMRLGRCQNCRMKGLLVYKAMITPIDLNPVTDHFPESVPKLLVCPTCFETPAGIQSINLEHKRLPDEEYFVK